MKWYTCPSLYEYWTGRRPRTIQHCTGPHVLELAPDEGTALARFHMLEIDQLEQLSVNFEDHPVPEIRRRGHSD